MKECRILNLELFPVERFDNTENQQDGEKDMINHN